MFTDGGRNSTLFFFLEILIHTNTLHLDSDQQQIEIYSPFSGTPPFPSPTTISYSPFLRVNKTVAEHISQAPFKLAVAMWLLPPLLSFSFSFFFLLLFAYLNAVPLINKYKVGSVNKGARQLIKDKIR